MVEFGHPRMIEHGTTRLSRWIRERRLRIALWIAVVESVLLLVHALPRLQTLFVAATIFVVSLFVREVRNETLREALWVAVVSQGIVALIPLLFIFVSALAFIAVGVLALFALAVLFSGRR
jgi:hypothetical protein